jgi:excisionase family DNA binding protein
MIETDAKLLSTDEAATRLGVSRRQVQTLIKQEKLPATKVGRDWFIRASDLRLVKERPKTGRPRGAKDSKPRRPKNAEALGEASDLLAAATTAEMNAGNTVKKKGG